MRRFSSMRLGGSSSRARPDRTPCTLTEAASRVEEMREHWRTPVRLPLSFCRVDIPENYEKDPFVRRRALEQWQQEAPEGSCETLRLSTTNVGGGGLAFRCPAQLLAGSGLFLRVEVRDCGVLEIAARVLRCRPEPEGDPYVVAARFLALDPPCASKLVRVLYENRSCR